jgi:hypothetical protein
VLRGGEEPLRSPRRLAPNRLPVDSLQRLIALVPRWTCEIQPDALVFAATSESSLTAMAPWCAPSSCSSTPAEHICERRRSTPRIPADRSIRRPSASAASMDEMRSHLWRRRYSSSSRQPLPRLFPRVTYPEWIRSGRYAWNDTCRAAASVSRLGVHRLNCATSNWRRETDTAALGPSTLPQRLGRLNMQRSAGRCGARQHAYDRHDDGRYHRRDEETPGQAVGAPR